MKNIQLIAQDLFGDSIPEKEKEVRQIFTGERRRIIEISLSGGAVLTKHNAAEPITVLCLTGSGTFRAGTNLEDSQKMEPGTLITLEPGIDHDLTAEPGISVLVTKFGDQ